MAENKDNNAQTDLKVVKPAISADEKLTSLNHQLKHFEVDLHKHIGISSFYDEAIRNLVINDEPRNAVEVKQGMVLVGDWLIDKSDELVHRFNQVNSCSG